MVNPKRKSVDSLKNAERAINADAVGSVLFNSHFAIADWLNPVALASPIWLNPFSIRNSFNLVAKFIILLYPKLSTKILDKSNKT